MPQHGKTRLRIASAVSALTLATALLAACSGAPSGGSTGSGNTGSTGGRTGCYPGTPDAPLEDTVIVNTTGGSITDALQDAFWNDFERDCGVKVQRFDMTARTYTQLQQFAAAPTAPFDMGNTYLPEEFTMGVRDNLFLKLPTDFWDANKSELIPGSYSDYGVWAYVAVRLMITNKNELPKGLATWADFFDAKKNPGPRAIQDIARSSIVMALLAKGYKQADIYPMTWEKVDEAFKMLDTLKPYVRTLTTKSDQPVQGVAAGDFAASWANTARALPAVEDGLPVQINWTAGGDVLNYHFYVIKNAQHPKAAEALIHYQLNAEKQAKFYKAFLYPASNSKVTDYLDADQAKEIKDTIALFTSSEKQQEWWIDNNDALQKRWSDWKAAGGFAN